MSEIQFIDTTLRDGQQSLWALGMKTGDMLSIAEQMDRAGFESVEFFVSIMIKKYVREHKENPWIWLKEGTKRFRRTRLRYHGGLRSSGSFGKLPGAVTRLLIERAIAHGITLTRTSDSWNDFQSLEKELRELRQMGMESIVNLIYSVSPRHTDAYYAQKAREAAAIRPYRICFKDVGGLLTVERARALIPVIVQNAGAIPVEFHAHCNNGLAPICYLEAVRSGIKTLHTAVPPLANGASQPSVITLGKNLRALGHVSPVDEAALEPVIEYLTAVAKRDGLAIGRPVEYDHAQYQHQVPGGMISNLRHQLRLVGMESKLPATLEEAARVRAEFGYPIMVTPLSQFVATQAAINVIVGERYREVTDQVIQYALGLWGNEAGALMDPDIKDRILGRRRAKDYEGWRPREVSLEDVRRQYGGPSISDEELILRVYAGPEAVMAMGSGELPPDPLSTRSSLVRLIEALSKRRERRRIFIRTGGLSLTLGERSERKPAT
jgi:oxaloacetate decarboxylase alpha subunit